MDANCLFPKTPSRTIASRRPSHLHATAYVAS